MMKFKLYTIYNYTSRAMVNFICFTFAQGFIRVEFDFGMLSRKFLALG